MAFALTKFQARGVDIAGPSNKRGIQQVVLNITGAAADVDLDIGDDAGTFWTAAKADSTYGSLATKALEVLQNIVANASSLVAVKSEQLIDRIQIAAVSGAGEYSLAVVNTRPNIAFNAADGETSYEIILEYELDDKQYPVVATYG
jgi:hypothetical protein